MPLDPTFDLERIKADPDMELAFTLSELENDNSPIGWSRYLPLARLLRYHYNISRKEKPK